MKKCANLCKQVEQSVLVILMAALLAMALPLHSQPSWNRLDIEGPSPEPRRGVGGIFDSKNNRVVFQGGESRPDPFPKFFSDTWVLDLEAQAWQELNGPRSFPNPRRDVVMAALMSGTKKGSVWSFSADSS